MGRIAVRDPAVRRGLALAGLTRHHLGILRTWRRVCEAALDVIVDELLPRDHRLTAERPRSCLRELASTMLAGRVDDAYVAARRHAGQGCHHGGGLDDGGALAMYETVRRVFVLAVRGAGADPEAQATFEEALGRLIQIDVALLVTGTPLMAPV